MHVRRLAVLLAASVALGMDPATQVSGLKEALRVAARNAAALTSRPDGYYRNPKIRIGVPESLKPMTRGLRQIGLKGPIDEFELAMNRSAESAAGEAFDVFSTAIAQMKVADARAIVGGGQTAATDYLRSTSSEELRLRFAPIVHRGMEKAGAVQAYERLLQHWRALPLATDPGLDLDAYVTDEALKGLFTMMGEEERKIRTDPSARVTDLLRQVFGARPAS
jgi:hypothetical protein